MFERVEIVTGVESAPWRRGLRNGQVHLESEVWDT